VNAVTCDGLTTAVQEDAQEPRQRSKTKAGVLLNKHIAEDGPTVFPYGCHLGAEGIASKRVDGAYQFGPCRIWIAVRSTGIAI
jgi:ATP-dependent DNA ligase